MTKTVTQIESPMEWESESDWDSHRELLYLALENTDGFVIELGSGFGSTPLLQDYCREKNRDFITYETNKEWAEKTGSVHTETYFKELGKIGLLFIDCAPGEIRKDLIEFYKEDAVVIMSHDTQNSAIYVYHMEEVLSSFKYRLDYQPKEKPSTTIVSETVNVCEWVM